MLRGEYLYTANGPGGFEVFDVANIDQKGFSERIVTAPVSPLGQRTYVHTKYATSVALPSTLALDPARVRLPENEEQPIDMFYAYVYVSDREEGLVVVERRDAGRRQSGQQFPEARRVPSIPTASLTGASFVTAAGHRLYMTTPRGLFVIDCTDPMHPRLAGQYTGNFLRNPQCVAIQFRYAFVTDDDGLKVLDITDPNRPTPVSGATVPLRNAQPALRRAHLRLRRERRGRPRDHRHRKSGAAAARSDVQCRRLLNDTRAVQIGSVNASQFALVADGNNGLRVVQMISPDTVPGAQGFSPRPNPRLIATYPTHGEALAVSRGLDRDRVVDETGGQTVVFGRRGSRPFISMRWSDSISAPNRATRRMASRAGEVCIAWKM